MMAQGGLWKVWSGQVKEEWGCKEDRAGEVLEKKKKL